MKFVDVLVIESCSKYLKWKFAQFAIIFFAAVFLSS